MELTEFIRRQIREQGPISFRDFMESALYHSEFGYYMTGGDKIGCSGDFYTSCCLGPVFGAMVAKQLAEMWRLSGEAEFTVVEFGAGDGRLCHDILDYFREHTALYDKLRYIIIEKSPLMREKERSHLPGKVCWHDGLESVGDFNGCVLSNELLDNFAVHQVVMQDELMEVFVDDQGGLIEVLRQASLTLKEYFTGLGIQLPAGYRAEVNLEAGEWLKKISRYLKKGYVLTIDYGYLSPDLYHPRHSRGTLLCYHRHAVSEHYYDHLGQQDITSHVNFSALCQWGEKYGLSCCGLTSQAAFLLALDFKSYLRQQPAISGDVVKQALQEARLTRTLLVGMGEKFKVLVQQKGMPDVTLAGLG